MDAARRALMRFYGYSAFRPGQSTLIQALLDGRDALGIMPTGAGKSLCYQVPGIVLPGLALVISPLVSLMRDQVDALIDAGVRGAYLNSTLTPGQQRTVMHRAEEGTYKIMYVAPERLSDSRFCEFVSSIQIPLIAVDEAHCVSQWGQDFRPSYLAIREFIEGLPQRPPVIALTATATDKVKADICELLGLQNPATVVTGYDRPNLRFSVEKLSSKKKYTRIADYITAHPGDSGIIYCSTRKGVEELATWLAGQGISVARYHAGMDVADRSKSQQRFIDDDALVMVATNAFGMGIDKSNVRYVVHCNMPKSIEAYYQEAGRAGRDGEPSECLLLWSDGDVHTCRYFIEEGAGNAELSEEEAERVRMGQRRMLEAMIGYCHTTGCLRRYILKYFGDEGIAEGADDLDPQTRERIQGVSYSNSPGSHGCATGTFGSCGTVRETPCILSHPLESKGCGNCSNCLGEFDSIDVTETAKRCVQCVRELGEVHGSFGKTMIADIVRGSKSARLLELGFDGLDSYNTVHDSNSQVKELIELLASEGFLRVSDGAYPVVSLGLRSAETQKDNFSFSMKRMKMKKAEVHGSSSRLQGTGSRTFASGADSPDNDVLFEKLRTLRKRIADAHGIPPYVVFSDKTLRDMCVRRPKTRREFLEVNGVGERKLNRYGETFMEEIAAFEQKM